MTKHIPDDFEVGLADAKMHYDYIATKMSRLKSLNNAPTALMAALDNEMLLAQNHINMLTLISDIGGEVKMACIRSIILGKLKVRYDRLVELGNSNEDTDKTSRIKESIMNEIIDLGSRLRSVG